MTPAYWTDADEAELELLVFELTGAHELHRARCEVCAVTGACEPMRRAIEAVIEWRDRRVLQSKAAHYRVREEVAA